MATQKPMPVVQINNYKIIFLRPSHTLHQAFLFFIFNMLQKKQKQNNSKHNKQTNFH